MSIGVLPNVFLQYEKLKSEIYAGLFINRSINSNYIISLIV